MKRSVLTTTTTAATTTAALAGLLLWQARRARRITRRLPGAEGAATGLVAAPVDSRRAEEPPVRLVVLGESTAAGVGAPTHEAALAGQTAAALAARTGRSVQWRVVGESGATAQHASAALVPQLPAEPADLVVLAVGVNDVIRRTRPAAFARDVRDLVKAVRARVGPVPVFVSAVPPVGRFPALPQPLRGVLGACARRLDRAARRATAGVPAVAHVPLRFDGSADEFMAADGFHPSPKGYASWGQQIAERAARLF